MSQHHTDAHGLMRTLKYFLNPNDGRFEDLAKGSRTKNIVKDLTAGLVVAMVAIPLAMGFAMASGLRPEQGIVGGAVAGLLGALFGGSKYQVYGPTAAYIPVIAGLMAIYNHSFLVLCSIIAGAMLMMTGLFKKGKVVTLVPHSIVVGFTIGIAIVIAMSQMGEVFGFKEKIGYDFMSQIQKTLEYLPDMNIYALIVALSTFAICKVLIKISVFIPAPIFGLGLGWLAAATFWSDKGLVLIKDKYGSIPTDFWVITMPSLPDMTTGQVWYDLLYFVVAIYFVAAVESLLCSRMADRLAGNTGLPYNPNKELWGQGMVNIFTPLFNGFPHTGALARTAVNIRMGAISPLAGIAKFVFKLLLAAYLATYLEQVPMACIGGILLYVASGMVKWREVEEVLEMKSKFHFWLMIYTAAMVPLTGFLPAVLSAIVIFALAVLTKKVPLHHKNEESVELDLADSN
ncbi:MAG: SulP family inorganic anion transporter [Methylotenera sp.]|nr:SulP family inorganic anion transporter [Methylotenera sp.]MDP1754990.1 SulP family inorganic anion transporter [Methylotenera sp.]MDP1958403.1 SulP family inorganic anion transporter [Methylotenera sp.]MDP3303465.1 SulP family inorganic anion transporter [Methylotenera sp.]MDP3943612.1 SulP family inorganic anion transporter [Methylotenera sp.]